MNVPHIGVSYLEDFPAEPFEELAVALQHSALNLKQEPRPRPGPNAGVEWLLPTAVVIFIGKAYFDAFLKEAGKDHYHVLKKALQKLTSKLTSPDAPTVRVLGVGGKFKSPPPKYSLVYSLVAQLDDCLSVKLLLQANFSIEDCNRAIACFFQFLDSLHTGTLDPVSVKGLAEAKPVGRMLLVEFNPQTESLEVVDPLPGHISY